MPSSARTRFLAFAQLVRLPNVFTAFADIALAACVAVSVMPSIASEYVQTIALLADLQRYANETAEELRRDLAAANQALNRARSDVNRVRMAVLLTLPGGGRISRKACA